MSIRPSKREHLEELSRQLKWLKSDPNNDLVRKINDYAQDGEPFEVKSIYCGDGTRISLDYLRGEIIVRTNEEDVYTFDDIYLFDYGEANFAPNGISLVNDKCAIIISWNGMETITIQDKMKGTARDYLISRIREEEREFEPDNYSNNVTYSSEDQQEVTLLERHESEHEINMHEGESQVPRRMEEEDSSSSDFFKELKDFEID